MKKNFGDRVMEAVKAKKSCICVGLDPKLDKIPRSIVARFLKSGDFSPLGAAAEAIFEFNKGIIDAVADLVPVVKPQSAFYEIFGHEGVRAYERTLKYAKEKGLITIADVKRGDIGNTCEAYAQAFLGEVSIFEGLDAETVVPVFDADAVTVNPYMGWDSVKPFLVEAEKYGKGVFVLVKTSNKSSGDFQGLEMKDGNPLSRIVGGFVDSWGADSVGESGYSSLGAVVGATYPEEARALREAMPATIFLVPGYGAQGGGAADVRPCFDADGMGALVNSSRGVIFAYEKYEMPAEAYAEAARMAVVEMGRELGKELG